MAVEYTWKKGKDADRSKEIFCGDSLDVASSVRLDRTVKERRYVVVSRSLYCYNVSSGFKNKAEAKARAEEELAWMIDRDQVVMFQHFENEKKKYRRKYGMKKAK